MRFDRGTDDAGDTGDSGMASDLVGVFNLCSTSVFFADSILWGLSDSGGLLSPSGSVLAGRVFRSECEASRKGRQKKTEKSKQQGKRLDERWGTELNQLVLIPVTTRPVR